MDSVLKCSDDLRTRWEEVRELGETICHIMAEEVKKLGLDAQAKVTAPWERVKFELVNDPATGQTSLSGVWIDQHGQRVGNIVFHCDGTFFAEYDVIQNHPSKPKWFVEAVNAWGKRDMIKAEPRLLPNVV